MLNPSHLLHDLQESISEALRRADERMSDVQRQVAGWSTTHSEPANLPDDTKGWDLISFQASQITEEIDEQLSSVQASLAQLVQQGRQMRETV